ncbi:MAG: hypothetical protein HKN33_04040 [Pyrinomonadaceae bacterium]|nr:hypothetical protein [Pyrinomonadaceae bacterium]
MKRFKTADEFFEAEERYFEELALLREIVLETELAETVKWGVPCYTLDGKNIVGIGSFKSYFGIWFFQGSFLKDSQKVLVNAQEGKTKGMRQWRIDSRAAIDRPLILKYLQEAIENCRAGKQIKPERKPLVIPSELRDALKADLALSEAFETLTLGKKREYAEHIGGAKKEETRLNRLQKSIPLIKSGVGLNDKYK